MRLRSASPLAGPLVRITAMAQRPWPELSAKMVPPGAKDPAPLPWRAHSLASGEKLSKRVQDAEPRSEGRPRTCRRCASRGQEMGMLGLEGTATLGGSGVYSSDPRLTAALHTQPPGASAARVAQALRPGRVAQPSGQASSS